MYFNKSWEEVYAFFTKYYQEKSLPVIISINCLQEKPYGVIFHTISTAIPQEIKGIYTNIITHTCSLINVIFDINVYTYTVSYHQALFFSGP